LVRAYRKLWRSDLPLVAALTVVERELGDDPYVAELVQALRQNDSRGLQLSRRPTSRPP
jgi:acyl-[acyl carrier protein]--UDP-N-acetylglucosamine O-acyltransferase